MTSGLRRGIVIEKIAALDLGTRDIIHVLTLRSLDDGCAEDTLVVSKEMYDQSCLEGFGYDTIVEYGTVLRIVTAGSEEAT
jgi:hypothetical protein